jgi:hopanoid C-3 methylase
MKILLVRPPVPKHTIGLKHIMICEPLELEYIGALLKNYEVRVCDLLVENNYLQQLKSFKPDIVASSAYKAGTNEVIKLFRLAKKQNPSIITIAGGVHATLVPEDYADVSVDIIGIGEGAILMKKIIDALAGQDTLWDIPGLAFPVGDGQIVCTQKKEYMEKADDLPIPDRSLVKHLQHKYYYLMHSPVATMKTTWGCWYKCNFCFTWKITDGTPYSRSPESIVEELLTIEAKDVYIVDDIFLIKADCANLPI